MRPATRHSGLATVGLSMLLLAIPGTAQAERAKRFATDAFSVELPRPVCFAVPVSLRDAASC